eukprot:1255768-Amphidinium_carterae.2
MRIAPDTACGLFGMLEVLWCSGPAVSYALYIQTLRSSALCRTRVPVFATPPVLTEIPGAPKYPWAPGTGLHDHHSLADAAGVQVGWRLSTVADADASEAGVASCAYPPARPRDSLDSYHQLCAFE